MLLIIKAASRSSRIPFGEKEAAIGMVPYIHSGEAMPSALAASTAPTPPRPCPSAPTAAWMRLFPNTEMADPSIMPSTHQPKICSSWTLK